MIRVLIYLTTQAVAGAMTAVLLLDLFEAQIIHIAGPRLYSC